ncbi:MAG: hypothetical protein KGS61_05510 [Verrucomicrobia bacterium]|nr:hypothetical protein [Verrucomicrobiota bacterium]
MKTFCLKVVAFLALQGMILALLGHPNLPGESNYLAATLDKHNRLEHTRPPRILLIGGSNLAFGIESDLLAQGLSRPVVNMGLIAGAGIPFMLNEVAGQVHRGDLVVCSFEYDLFAGGDYDLNLRQLLELRPRSFWFLPLSKWKRFLTDYGMQILGGDLRRMVLPDRIASGSVLTDFGYQRQGFDADGSYIGHYGSPANLAMVPANSPLLAKSPIPPMTPFVREKIARFAQLCHQRGARCLFTCPPQPPVLLAPILPVVRANLAELATIPHVRVLDQPTDETYPLTEFYDTRYHLTRVGILQRTRKLIAELRPLVSASEHGKFSNR